MKYILAIFLIFIVIQVFSQNKLEREYRIQASEVPDKAIQFVAETYSEDLKIKWYLEESDDGKSYEAKFKWNKNRHSVEFDFNGIIEDIEIIAQPESIPQEVLLEVKNEIAYHFDRFKIRKIQVQYSGTAVQLSNAIKNFDYKQVVKKFEIIVEGNKDRQIGLWECLFDADGKLLSKRRIIEKPTNNLDF